MLRVRLERTRVQHPGQVLQSNIPFSLGCLLAIVALLDRSVQPDKTSLTRQHKIRGDGFHVCSSQFQSFQWFDGLTMSGFILNRFAPFITGISPFQAFQSFNRFAPFKSFQTVSM